MAPPSSPPALNEDLEIKAREQLARILPSRTFHQADRLKRFIGFIVQETLAGRGNQLKEFLLGMEVFGKDARFDPRTDPLVRVQARRLRVRLARYNADEGQGDEILIELPKGEYAPVIKRNQPPPKRASSAALVGRNTVVVLPFIDYTPQRDQGFFCKGVKEEIILTLMRTNHLKVVAQGGGASESADPRDAADRLNAAVLIAGSIRRSRDEFASPRT